MKLKWRIEDKYPPLEFVSRQWNGHVETPDFRGKYEKEMYQADRRAKFTIQLPENLEVEKNSRFVVNLQVETAEVTGWDENVIYSVGPTFLFHPERKSWQEGEKTCVEEGGHLASVRSFSEAQELMKLDVKGTSERCGMTGLLKELLVRHIQNIDKY